MLIEAANDLTASTKWLDVRSLCAAYLSTLAPQAVLESIYYFSALAKRIDAHRPGTTLRHRNYVECLTEFLRFLHLLSIADLRCKLSAVHAAE